MRDTTHRRRVRRSTGQVVPDCGPPPGPAKRQAAYRPGHSLGAKGQFDGACSQVPQVRWTAHPAHARAGARRRSPTPRGRVAIRPAKPSVGCRRAGRTGWPIASTPPAPFA